jgi:hypothetical protein
MLVYARNCRIASSQGAFGSGRLTSRLNNICKTGEFPTPLSVSSAVLPPQPKFKSNINLPLVVFGSTVHATLVGSAADLTSKPLRDTPCP